MVGQKQCMSVGGTAGVVIANGGEAVGHDGG